MSEPVTPPHHFEQWPSGPTSAIDPQPLMRSWQIYTPDDVAPFLEALRRNAAAERITRCPESTAVRRCDRR